MKKYISLLFALLYSLLGQAQNSHEYVDLGLPSRTLWATCNIGAETPEDYGNYYTWPDAVEAVSTWGDPWEMMTKEDRDELTTVCKRDEVTINNVKGVQYTGTNGNSIFLPYAGYRQGSYVYNSGNNAQYWTSTTHQEGYNYYVLIAGEAVQKDDAANYWPNYYFGLSVRLVIHGANIPSYVITATPIDGNQGDVVGSGEYQADEEVILTAIPNRDYEFAGWSDGTKENPYKFNAEQDIEITATFRKQTSVNGHDFVDLGLPSGLLWGTCYVGAETILDHGDYFHWGNPNPVTPENCKVKDYCTSSTDISGTEYDIAKTHWGENWRMPKRTECLELINNTTRTIEDIDGVEVMIVVGPNGNKLYIPIAGSMKTTGPALDGFGFWTSTPTGQGYAYRQWEWTYVSFSEKELPFPVRPVHDKLAKCAKPSVTYQNGRIVAMSETENSICHISGNIPSVTINGYGEATPSLTLTISVYATAPNYLASDDVSIDVPINIGEVGDVNRDGEVSISDVSALVNKLLNKE